MGDNASALRPTTLIPDIIRRDAAPVYWHPVTTRICRAVYLNQQIDDGRRADNRRLCWRRSAVVVICFAGAHVQQAMAFWRQRADEVRAPAVTIR